MQPLGTPQTDPPKGYFTGIGSRDTPEQYLIILEEASRYITSTHKLMLRSGHAVGADRACEVGAQGYATIYLPWHGYGVKSYRDDPGMTIMGHTYVPTEKKFPEMTAIAEFMCSLVDKSSYQSMRRGIKTLMFRNIFQLLGHSSKSVYSKLILCYDPGTGGTSYTTALARHFNIPIINVIDKDLDTVLSEISKTLTVPKRKLL